MKSQKGNKILNIVFYAGVVLLLLLLLYPYSDTLQMKRQIFPISKTLNYHNLTMKKGETTRIYPVNYYKSVTYTSTDFKVAEVNTTGRVKAKRKGIAVIKVDVGKKVFKCRIKVT